MPKGTTTNVQRFAKLDEAVQDDLLLWSQWDEAEWAEDVIENIEAGNFDNYLARIVTAGNSRMASVFKGWDDTSLRSGASRDEAVAIGSRLDGMKAAMEIVRDLGLKAEYEVVVKQRTKKGAVKERPVKKEKVMPVTRENYTEIIAEHGDRWQEWKTAQEAAAPKRRRKKISAADKAAATKAAAAELAETMQVEDEPSKARKSKVIDVKEVEYRPTEIMAQSIKAGDKVDGKVVESVEKIGTASVKINFARGTNVGYRRTTKVAIERPK
jgi:hypothetical protein